MKKIGLVALLFCFSGSVIFTSCLGKEDAIEYPKQVNTSDYDLSIAACNWKIQSILRDTLYIINSAEELGSYTSCQQGNAPAIDFNKHTLLLTMGGMPQWVLGIEKTFVQNSVNKYKLAVDITMDMTTIPGFWSVAIITPKIPSNANIELNINKHH